MPARRTGGRGRSGSRGAPPRPRFLRARDMSVESAAAMVKNTLAWRVTYRTDAIAQDTSVPACLADIAQLMVRGGPARPARAPPRPAGAYRARCARMRA